MSTTVLLGAGASVEAGVPATVGMTEAIVRAINDDPMQTYRGTAQALNYAVGALIAYDTGRGASPYDGVDVERLFSGVRMLGDREELEVAPFVASWAPALDAIGVARRFPAFFKRDFDRAMSSRLNTDLERVFTAAVEAVSGRKDSGAVFRALETAMLEHLRELVAVDPSRVDYLRPLLNTHANEPIQIATLNYDRSVEELCSRAGQRVDTGIDDWAGGHDWHWHKEADVRLLKLHGSMDWALINRREEGKIPEPRIVKSRGSDDRGEGTPGLLFGQGSKLRSDGPFLAMLRAFDTFLQSSDCLIVVGYSFRDTHINGAIRRWLNASGEHSLSIIDPGFVRAAESQRRPATFAQDLLQAMRSYQGDRIVVDPRLNVVEKCASEGLIELLGEGPVLSANG